MFVHKLQYDFYSKYIKGYYHIIRQVNYKVALINYMCVNVGLHKITLKILGSNTLLINMVKVYLTK